MDLSILWAEKMPIPPHAVVAFCAFVLGLAQIVMPKGTALHRSMGRIWVGFMAFVALSSFFIHELRVVGLFSPIHLLSGFTLVMLVVAVNAARRGNIDRHRRIMYGLFFLALVLTGAFTLMPGRAMHQVLFGG